MPFISSATPGYSATHRGRPSFTWREDARWRAFDRTVGAVTEPVIFADPDPIVAERQRADMLRVHEARLAQEIADVKTRQDIDARDRAAQVRS